MGRFSAESETIFNHPPEVVYDFVSNPANWGRTYKGSGGVHQELKLPLKVGDTWSEQVDLPPNLYVSEWTLITARRPWRWVFQQINKVGLNADGTGGVDGITTISYKFEQAGQGMTLFTRKLETELPKGVGVPDDLLTVCCRPDGIDRYHAAIEKELDALHGKNQS